MSLITDIRPGEPDLIAGHANEALELRSLTGRKLASIPVTECWTHERLVAAIDANRHVVDEDGGADYYLGSQFVGSTEI
jgi:5'-deoxynucleotidase